MFTIANAVHQINEEILDKEVRLIGDQGEQLGIMSIDEAMQIATEREMDGMARVFNDKQNKRYTDEFFELQDAAKEAKIGIWAGDNND